MADDISLLCKTWPFFLASSRFLGVARSVLSWPALSGIKNHLSVNNFIRQLSTVDHHSSFSEIPKIIFQLDFLTLQT